MIQENKVVKYALYAVGEIVLVVIGIMIAVSINNQNQFKKDRVLETEYIQRLQKELKGNIRIFDGIIAYSELEIKYANILINTLENEQPINGKDFAVALELLSWTYPVDYRDNAWEEMISTGNIGLLLNDSLKIKLSDFHQRLAKAIELQQEGKSFNLGFGRVVSHVLAPSLRIRIADQMHPARGYFGDIKEWPDPNELIKAFKNVTHVRGFLADITVSQQTGLYKFRRLTQKAQDILKICNQELANR